MATVEGRVICWWEASLATSCYLWFPPRRVFLVLTFFLMPPMILNITSGTYDYVCIIENFVSFAYM